MSNKTYHWVFTYMSNTTWVSGAPASFHSFGWLGGVTCCSILSLCCFLYPIVCHFGRFPFFTFCPRYFWQMCLNIALVCFTSLLIYFVDKFDIKSYLSIVFVLLFIWCFLTLENYTQVSVTWTKIPCNWRVVYIYTSAMQRDGWQLVICCIKLVLYEGNYVHTYSATMTYIFYFH